MKSRIFLRALRIILKLLSLFAFSSCTNQYRIENIGKIEYPDSALVIVDEKETDLSIISLPALCYWLDSTKCTPCEYDMLYNFEPYYWVLGETSFFAIVTPATTHKDHIDYKTSINYLPFPVVVDKSCFFYRNNNPVYVKEGENSYIYIDENGVGYELILPEGNMIYDIGRIIDCFMSNIR